MLGFAFVVQKGELSNSFIDGLFSFTDTVFLIMVCVTIMSLNFVDDLFYQKHGLPSLQIGCGRRI